MEKVYLDLADHLEGVARSQDLTDYRDLVEHNEGVIALQNICQNLYEYDTPLSRPVFDHIVSVARQAGLAGREWAFLEELVEDA